MDNNELMHYGVRGMKWGKRKAYDPTSRGGSITRNGKYRASNGIVVERSKNTGAAIGVGGSIATAMLQGKTMSDNKKLRAYYGHTGNRVYD